MKVQMIHQMVAARRHVALDKPMDLVYGGVIKPYSKPSVKVARIIIYLMFSLNILTLDTRFSYYITHIIVVCCLFKLFVFGMCMF